MTATPLCATSCLLGAEQGWVLETTSLETDLTRDTRTSFLGPQAPPTVCVPAADSFIHSFTETDYILR